MKDVPLNEHGLIDSIDLQKNLKVTNAHGFEARRSNLRDSGTNYHYFNFFFLKLIGGKSVWSFL